MYMCVRVKVFVRELVVCGSLVSGVKHRIINPFALGGVKQQRVKTEMLY